MIVKKQKSESKCKKRFLVSMDKDIFQALKILCVKKDTSMNKIILNLVKKHLTTNDIKI